MTAKHDASTLFLLTNAHVFLRMQRFIGKMAADAKKEDAPSVTYRDALRHLERTYPDVPPKERQLYQSLLYQYFGTPAGTDGDTKLALPVVAPVPVRATPPASRKAGTMRSSRRTPSGRRTRMARPARRSARFGRR